MSMVREEIKSGIGGGGGGGGVNKRRCLYLQCIYIHIYIIYIYIFPVVAKYFRRYCNLYWRLLYYLKIESHITQLLKCHKGLYVEKLLSLQTTGVKNYPHANRIVIRMHLKVVSMYNDRL